MGTGGPASRGSEASRHDDLLCLGDRLGSLLRGEGFVDLQPDEHTGSANIDAPSDVWIEQRCALRPRAERHDVEHVSRERSDEHTAQDQRSRSSSIVALITGTA